MGVIDYSTRHRVDALVASAGWVTRRITHPFYGSRGSVTAAGSVRDWSQRDRLVLPVTPTRVRFRIRNIDPNTGVEGGGVVMCQGAWVGLPSIPASDRWLGAFASAPTQVLAPFVLTDGADTITDWIDAAALGLTAGVPFGTSLGFTAEAGAAIRYAGGQLWHGAAGAAAAAGGKSYASDASYGLMDIRLEYDCLLSPDRPVVLVIGTSIEEGAIGSGGQATPHESWPGAAALRHGWPVINLGLGSAVYGGGSGWQTPSLWRWNRADLSTTVPDVCILGGPTNDAAGSLPGLQASYRATIDSIRALGIADIWANTMLAYDSTHEANRLAFNTWVAGVPYGLSGAIEMAKALELQGTSNPVQNDGDYVSTTPHPERRGYQRMAQQVPSFARVP